MSRYVGVEKGLCADRYLSQEAGVSELIERIVDGRKRDRDFGERRFLVKHFSGEVARALVEQKPTQSQTLTDRVKPRSL